MFQAPDLQEKIYRYKTITLIAVLIIFYLVGIVGLSLDAYRKDFLELSFMNLALSFTILLLGRTKYSKGFYAFILFAFLVGMIVEWIGVHTGMFFGNYSYGENLGFKIYGVPFIIGLNWVMLTIISASVIQLLKTHWLLKAILAALLMLVLDLLIEPVAIKSDYWSWNDEIPISNFVTWFIIAVVLQWVYFKFKLAEKNKVAISLYLLQFVFFMILNLQL